MVPTGCTPDRGAHLGPPHLYSQVKKVLGRIDKDGDGKMNFKDLRGRSPWTLLGGGCKVGKAGVEVCNTLGSCSFLVRFLSMMHGEMFLMEAELA